MQDSVGLKPQSKWSLREEKSVLILWEEEEEKEGKEEEDKSVLILREEEEDKEEGEKSV